MAVITQNRVRIQREQEVENAIASVRMEGLEPSAGAKEIFQRYIDGELTSAEKAKAFEEFLNREYGPVCLSGDGRP